MQRTNTLLAYGGIEEQQRAELKAISDWLAQNDVTTRDSHAYKELVERLAGLADVPPQLTLETLPTADQIVPAPPNPIPPTPPNPVPSAPLSPVAPAANMVGPSAGSEVVQAPAHVSGTNLVDARQAGGARTYTQLDRMHLRQNPNRKYVGVHGRGANTQHVIPYMSLLTTVLISAMPLRS